MAIGEAVALADSPTTPAITSGSLRARHDAVEDVVVGREAAEGADRALAAGPEALAVGALDGLAHLAGAASLADRARALAASSAVDFGQAFDLDQQHGAGVQRVADVQRRLDGADDLAVHHLQRRRHQAGAR